MNTKQAIEKVMTDAGKPMRVPDIIEAGLKLATSLKGKTPGQTFYSTLYAENKKADGLVVQVERGTFKLNPKRKPLDAPRTRTTSKAAAPKAAAAKKKAPLSATARKRAAARKSAAKKAPAKKRAPRKAA